MKNFAIKINSIPEYRDVMNKMKKLNYEEDRYWNDMMLEELSSNPLFLTKGEGENFLSLFKNNIEEENIFESFDDFKKVYNE